MSIESTRSSRPALLLVLTISLVLLALAAYWLAALPQRLARGLAEGMATEHQVSLDYVSPRLTFNGRPMLVLDSVVARPKDADSFDLTARSVVVAGGWRMLFGGAAHVQEVILDKPVLTLDVAAAKPLYLPAVQVLAYRDGVLRLKDKSRSAVVAVSDVNGRIMGSDAGHANVQASFLLNNILTFFTADVESAQRLSSGGSPVDAVLNSNGQTIAFSGLARLESGLALDGRMTVDAASLATFSAWLGVPLNALENAGALQFESGASMSGLALRLPSLAGVVGDSSVTGEVQLVAGADRPKLTGTLASESVTLLPKSVQPTGFAQAWPETPWPVQDLLRLDADMTVSAKDLNLHDVSLGPATLTLRNDAGQAAVSVHTAQEEATAKLDLGLALQKGSVATTLALEAKGVDARTVLGGFFDFPFLSGPATVSMTLAGEGRHLAGVVSTLKGSLAINGTQLALSDINLGSLLALQGQGWQNAAGVATSDLRLTLKGAVAEGIVTLADSSIDGAGLALKPKGEVDLLRQAFDVALQPAVKGMDPKLRLSGTWVSPLFQVGAPSLRTGEDGKGTKTAAPPPAN